jgi:5-bromo-4-chloroindolyl phosphate hydrolysis protein
MSLLTFTLSVAAILAVIVAFLIMYMRRVADVALTEQFRAAESIVSGRIPDRWVAQINRRLVANRLVPIFQRNLSGTELALRRIDKLIKFFVNSPFFENEEVRKLLLTQLQGTRQRWARMTWDELVSGQD